MAMLVYMSGYGQVGLCEWVWPGWSILVGVARLIRFIR